MKLRDWLWHHFRWRSAEEAYLDRQFPLLALDSDARDESGNVIDADWRSPTPCRTIHGRAVVYWHSDGPLRVLRAAQPGRGAVFDCYGIEGKRMRRREGRGWVHGTVVVEPERVLFNDGELTPWNPYPHDGPSLEADLARDKEFVRRLQDDDFARAVYGYLQNREFSHVGSGERFLFSWRRGAEMIAGLRGIGEIYLDYYPYENFDGPAERRAALETEFLDFCRKLGWQMSGHFPDDVTIINIG
jgi:hypothetical protein